MPVKPCFFLLLFCSILSFCAPAQQWGFESLGTERGLPASETYNMFQDDKGYIYIATEYGMVKYNGSRFVPVCNNIPARERIAYAFCKRDNGECCFINSQSQFYTIRNDSAFALHISGKPVPAFPHNSPVNRLAMDSAGNLYADAPYKGFVYEAAKQKWMALNDKDALTEHAEITKLTGKFFISTYSKGGNRLLVRNTAYAGQYKIADASPGSTRFGVSESRQGLYLVWKDRLLQIKKHKAIRQYRTQANIVSFKVTSDGHLWLGLLRKGLLELDTNLLTLHHYLDGLTVADVLFDRQEGVWITTLEQGVFHCKNKHEYHYNNANGISGEIRFMKVLNDKFFAGTVTGKLLSIDGENSRVVDLEGNDILDAIAWKDGYLVAGKNCLLALDTRLQPSVLKRQSCYRLLPQAGNFLTVGPTTLMLYSGAYVLKQELDMPSKIRCVLPWGPDSILAGCTKGIFVIRGNQYFIPPGLALLNHCNISDMKKSKDGHVWFGTKGDGLFLLAPGKRLKKIEAPSGIITNISFFRDSIMLLSTNIGLYAGRYGRAGMEWMGLYDGEVLNALPYRHQVFIGTKYGLVACDTAALFHPPLFPVYLSAVDANGRTADPADIRIQPWEHDLTFRFDVLSYKRQAVPLAYQLSGPLSSRGFLAGTTLFLQNLPPGHYLLQVYAGTEKRQVLRVPFFIRPAFWQTKIFVFFTSLGGLGLLLIAGYLLYRGARNLAYKKAAIGRMLSEYKLTALKAQINPHFMSNSLAAIQQLMLSNDVDKAGRYLALFSLLIRQVLQYSDKSLVPLSDELKIIELNISLEQLRFSDQFIFETELDPGIDPRQLYIPPLITQPFIENAIWHGLLPLKGKRRPKLKVSVHRDGDQVVLSVVDNGVGRPLAPRQNPFRDKAFASRGLDLTQSRIENLNQLYPRGKAQMKIIDLHDATGAAGTRIEITLPYIPDIAYGNQYQESYYRR